jgi:hypothetical protein
MARLRWAVTTAAAVAIGLGGCAAKSGTSTGAPPARAQAPADSPLAKVQIGTTAQQVSSILGMPTNQVSYASGKACIPFYFGSDVRRTEWSYKGLGRVVFTGGNQWGGGGGQVERVDYDPTETGIRPPS